MNMKHLRHTISLLCILLLYVTAGWSAHITDRLVAGLYSEPDTIKGPIKALTSGTPLQVLERKEAFSNVRLGDNTEGWVQNRYITEEKPARVMLLELQAKNSDLQNKLLSIEAKIEAGPAPAAATEASQESVKTEIATLKQQLSESNREVEALKQQRSETKSEVEALEEQQSDTKSEVVALEEQRSDTKSKVEALEEQLAEALRGEAEATHEAETLQQRLESSEAGESLAERAKQQLLNTAQALTLWHYLAAVLLLPLSFISGILFKNYRLSKRYGGFRI
ncbi:MAG: TIGR04211 family SH3 domain-containing protein [Sedimenticola sp.]